uniref:Uncharacterized protein n=1 Tax=Anguilla anguilla TaxID=7936 RepID=A0A0E9WZ59_ANGAN
MCDAIFFFIIGKPGVAAMPVFSVAEACFCCRNWSERYL